MRYLLDTNVLLRLVDRQHSHQVVARAAVRKLQLTSQHLFVSSQNFTEFWNACSRPIQTNGLGWDLAKLNRYLRVLERDIVRVPDSADVYPQWRRLVVQYGVMGAKVHDARLVAFMLVNRVTHILTFNTADFARYAGEGVTAVDPATV